MARAAADERAAVPVDFGRADGADIIQQLTQCNIKELGLRYAGQFCVLQVLACEEKSLVAVAGAGAGSKGASPTATSLNELIAHLAALLGQSEEQLRAQIDTVLQQLEAQARLNGGTAVATFAISLVGVPAEADHGAAGAIGPTGASALGGISSWIGGFFSWGSAGSNVSVKQSTRSM